MKGLRKIVAVVLGVAMLFGMLQVPVKAEAAGKQTFTVVYDAGNSRWCYKIDDSDWSANLAAIKDNFKDGDVLSILGEPGLPMVEITTNARISELGVSKASAKVSAKGVDLAYAVEGSTLIINSDVKKATCYPGSTLQVNGNVDEFVAVYTTDDSAFPIFAVTGTVAKADVKYTESPYKVGTIYNVKEGKFVSSGIGNVWLAADEYSKTPATTGNNKKGELDDVPKTGYGLAGSLIFFLLAAGCACVGVLFKKKEATR